MAKPEGVTPNTNLPIVTIEGGRPQEKGDVALAWLTEAVDLAEQGVKAAGDMAAIERLQRTQPEILKPVRAMNKAEEQLHTLVESAERSSKLVKATGRLIKIEARG